MDGLLVLDKPVGPTSHDVVARMRRVLGVRRIGHTGTLDPQASGVLPLVIGQATRLARFLSAGDKGYDAVIELGVRTTTFDRQGTPVGDRWSGPWPTREQAERALEIFRGTFPQQPPVYSAKTIGGRRSYKTARAAARRADQTWQTAPTVAPAPVPVTVRRLALVEVEGPHVRLQVECSAGFYVRSLAHDLGEHLGVGAHLAALRRTRSGDWTLADARPLEAVADRQAALTALIPMVKMLPRFDLVELSEAGVRRASLGQDVGPDDLATRSAAGALEAAGDGGQPGCHGGVRLIGPSGELVAVGEPSPRPGFLHPSVVLV